MHTEGLVSLLSQREDHIDLDPQQKHLFHHIQEWIISYVFLVLFQLNPQAHFQPHFSVLNHLSIYQFSYLLITCRY